MQHEYKFLLANDPKALEADVNRAAEDDWEVIGTSLASAGGPPVLVATMRRERRMALRPAVPA